MRLNNTRQALLFFFLLRFSPPGTSSCPQPHSLTGFLLQPTLYLYLFFHFYPSVSPVSPHMHVISQLHSPGFTFFFVFFFFLWKTPFASLYPLSFMSFYCFYFALLCCIICCQVCLPVFVTHTYMQEFI